MLSLSIIAFNEDNKELKTLNWETVSFSKRGMTLQIQFDYPFSISEELDGKDRLVIEVINPVFFLSETTL